MVKRILAILASATVLASGVALGTGSPAQATLPCPPLNATWSSTAQFGSDSWQGYTVNNNEWGAGHASQYIWDRDTAPVGFGVCAIAQPKTVPNNVKAYPNAGKTYPGNTWSSYTTIKGVFDMTPSVIPAYDETLQMLWDICLNAQCNNSSVTEVGVAPYRFNEGTPFGTFLGNATLNGRTYGVYNATAPGGHTFYAFNETANEQSGTIGIKSALTWLQSHGYLTGSETLQNISGGWEISNSETNCGTPCGTPCGNPTTLEMNGFSITAS